MDVAELQSRSAGARIAKGIAMSPQPPKLSLQGIRKSFIANGTVLPVLAGIALEVARGGFLSVNGPSGCGKTTVFSISAGLLRPDAGSPCVDGEVVSDLRGRVGCMMHKDLLFPWRTVLENVLLGLELTKLPAPQARELARDYLHAYGLSGFENAYPRALSSGVRQRVALIRTLICDPDVVLLDEPFSALDYQTRLYLEGVLIETADKHRKTLILVTHDIAERSPNGARSDPRFSSYFHALCADLDTDWVGLFTKQGLDVVKETAGSPGTALAAVISGSAQCSLHGPEWPAIAASKGAPVQIVANCVHGAAVWIATTPDFKFTSVKDLKGETAVTGQMPTTSTSLFFKLPKENGLDAKQDLKLIGCTSRAHPRTLGLGG